MNITEFLLARIAEDENIAQAGISSQADPENGWGYEGRALTPHVGIVHEAIQAAHITRWHPYRVLAECKAKREIIKLHEEWPVLVEGNPETETVNSNFDNISLRMTQQIMWTTERAYLAKFGTTPPTAPMISSLAAVYADHPDYQQEWKH